MDQDDRRSFGLVFEVENLIANCYSETSFFRTAGAKRTVLELFSPIRILGSRHSSIGKQSPTVAYDAASANLAILYSHLAQIGESDIRSPIDTRSGFVSVFARLSKEEQIRQRRHNQQEQIIFACAYFLECIASSITRSALYNTKDVLYHSLLSKILIAQDARAATVQASFSSVSRRRKRFVDLPSFGIAFDEIESLKPSTNESLLNQVVELSCDILSGDERGAPGKFFPTGIGCLAMGNIACRASRILSYSDLLQTDLEIQEMFVNPPEVVRMKPLLLHHDETNLVENVDTQPWHQNEYVSYSPKAIKISDAIVQGSVGIVCCTDSVVDESLWHTDPRRHRYNIDDGKVCLFAKTIEDLKGTTAAVLTGSAESYWHTLVDVIARLAIIPRSDWLSIDRILYPSTGVKIDELLDLYDLPESIERRVVYPDETFRLQHFIYPSSIHGLFDYHPTVLKRAFGSIVRNTGLLKHADAGELLYIDRGPSALRPLLNESEVIACLPEFRPVGLAGMTISEQVRLFSEASIIVAPHGAGLTNMVFASAGCIVIEIMMDRYCNWCYRRIANIMEQDYYCVVGRAQTLDVPIHSTGWTVDVKKVRETVDTALREAGRAS